MTPESPTLERTDSTFVTARKKDKIVEKFPMNEKNGSKTKTKYAKSRNSRSVKKTLYSCLLAARQQT